MSDDMSDDTEPCSKYTARGWSPTSDLCVNCGWARITHGIGSPSDHYYDRMMVAGRTRVVTADDGDPLIVVEDAEAPDLGPGAVPDRIAIDAKGYGWRAWDKHPEMWSMVPQNPDNSPIPKPVTWFVPAELFGEVVDWLGVPGWSGPQLPEDLARRIAAVLRGCQEATDA